MNMQLPFLREKTSKLTSSPGVYIMKNSEGSIIYIGKAKNLHKRVSSYFRENPSHTPKVSAMVSHVHDYDFIVTDSEYEALLLECSLIKQHQPKYNILLKDDKGYHYIRVSDEPYPRITSEKNTLKSGTYLGPYTSGSVAEQTVSETNRTFMLPDCNRKFPQDFGKHRPCLNYQIKLCMGLCTGKISRQDYISTVNQAVDFIKNGCTPSIERLQQEMLEASENLEFEKACILRDRIIAIKKSGEKQKIMNMSINSADVIGTAEFSDTTFVSVLIYRENRLFDKKVFEFEKSDEDILSKFITQFYYTRTDIPKNIVLEHLPDDFQLIDRFIQDKAHYKVNFQVPKRKSIYLDLLVLAKNNSAEYAGIKNSRTAKEVTALEQLAELLGLSSPPEYIEAYDISNLSSDSISAGMVVFQNGRPLKKAYKHFNVKTQVIQNDYGSMKEVLQRRLMHIVNQDGDEFFNRTPDLILLDGGKGHVNTVAPIISELGLDIKVFGMVKDSKHRTRAIATGGKEIQISNLQSAFMLVTRIQDEVHRYSVKYMHSKHRQKFSSELLTVKGIGEKKLAKILKKFSTREKLKSATPEELALTAGVNINIANELYNKIKEI